MLTRVSKLADKAMLVRLTIRRAALTKRDKALTAKVQQAEGDTSLQVLTKLFKDKDGPIAKIMKATNDVYLYHRANTLPYVDAGPRILPSANYFDYTNEMKHRIAVVDTLLAQHMPNYDQYVLDDVALRNNGQVNGRAHPSEYPTAEQFKQSMQLDFRFMPMPDARHFLFDLSEEDLAAVEQAEAEALEAANSDTVERMLKPLAALIKKLDDYRGEAGQRWHNSVIENVLDGCRQARKLVLHPTPELLSEIEALEGAAAGFLSSVETLKGSANARAEARRKLAEAADKMAAFF